ncbi:hypothetical protein [Flavicella sp.]|uniref:hypothetical protein n=1 Tax=Flavicella sp. TaxID=2957742 RepID=UPI002636D86C|nr:hypothetical protein [Flavicella sp.]MDG1805307.1 hypothetical protein [Flavicella sp.]
MKTIQESVESIIRKTPFYEEALNDKLINVSSLARAIQEDVESDLGKEVKSGAIMMAINRLSPSNLLRIRKNIRKFTFSLGDFIVRSNLCNFTYKNTPTLLRSITSLLNVIGDDKDYFFTISQGIFETNIVTSKNLEEQVKELFSKEILIYGHNELASITIKLPKTNVEQSGVYYFILKQLAWAGISVQEIISTTHEMTIVVKEEDVNNTFSILIDMKKK